MLKIACDRCGTIFDRSGEVNFYEKYWRLSILRDNHPYPEERLDLCPTCQKKLLKWLEEGDIFAEK